MASINFDNIFPDELLESLSNDIEQQNYTSLSICPTNDALDALLNTISSPISFPFEMSEFNSNQLTPNGDSPDRPTSSEPSPGSSTGEFNEQLTMIAEPFYGNKLRYRSDFQANQNRLGTLKNRTNHSSYQGPAIRIPQQYLSNNRIIHIRVTLVTAQHPRTGARYIHPYELENANQCGWNDKENNSVWFQIQPEDQTGIKSFGTLRIVKKTITELKSKKTLQIFSYNDVKYPDSTQTEDVSRFTSSSPKKLIKEFNLDQSHLAFTVFEEFRTQSQSSAYQPFWHTTVLSQVMIEKPGEDSVGDQGVQLSNEIVQEMTSNCRIQQYVPRYGFKTGGEDMIIAFTEKLEPRKYGEIKVVFQYTQYEPPWICEVASIIKKDRWISFKTPSFPYYFEQTIRVEVIISQTNRALGHCQYFYLQEGQCGRCQHVALVQNGAVPPDGPNKRTSWMFNAIEEDEDAIVPKAPTTNVELHHSRSNPTTSTLSNSSPKGSTSNGVSAHSSSLPRLSTENLTPGEQLKFLMDKLRDMTTSLFVHRDEKPLILICRPFIKEDPEMIHQALENHYDDLLMKYLPFATLPVLQYRFKDKGTFLLHSIRLNRIDLVKILCENVKPEIFEKILEDVDDHGNNLFHLLVSDPTRLDLLDFIIEKLLEKKISIVDKFDRSNDEKLTPLQTAIRQNNRQATQRLLKHFKTNVVHYENNSGDNLLHLAVRHGDLDLVKCLIEDGNLVKQGEESNLIETPVDLAKTLNREEIIEYFRKIYPQIDEKNECANSESDDDDDDDDDDDQSPTQPILDEVSVVSYE